MTNALIAAVPPLQSKVERPLSLDPAAFSLPTGREEEWRFTPVTALKPLLSDDSVDEGGLKVVVSANDGVTVERVARGDERIARSWLPDERTAAIALAKTASPLLISVDKEAEVAQPIEIDLQGQGGLGFDHIVLEVGAFANVTVVLHHTGTGTISCNLETIVGDGAKVTVVTLQEWEDSAIHLGHHPVFVGRDATYRGYAVTLGGAVVRLNPTVNYAAPGGDAELYGVFFADAGQHLENRVLVDHTVPNCRSRVVYKGALQGETARSVWIGDVVIRAAAIGTDTYELNRNLILTDGARADSVPNLEIETGEIAGAGHASATGRFDDAALFYLQSRGIPRDEAMRMVVRGFFGEILDRLEIPSLVVRLGQAIDAELEGR